MNLYVDDVRRCPYLDWFVARTIAIAKEILTLGSVDACSLDHDMGACADCVSLGRHVGDMATPETTFLNWCPHVEDGTSLVRWMVETGHWPNQKPTVHSANPVGRQRMQELIDRFWGDPAHGPMFYAHETG
jgi:hypothetical protein